MMKLFKKTSLAVAIAAVFVGVAINASQFVDFLVFSSDPKAKGKEYNIFVADDASVGDVKKQILKEVQEKDFGFLKNAAAFLEWELFYGGSPKENNIKFSKFYDATKGELPSIVITTKEEKQTKKEEPAMKAVTFKVLIAGKEDLILSFKIPEDLLVYTLKRQLFNKLREMRLDLSDFTDYTDWHVIAFGKSFPNSSRVFDFYSDRYGPPTIKLKLNEKVGPIYKELNHIREAFREFWRKKYALAIDAKNKEKLKEYNVVFMSSEEMKKKQERAHEIKSALAGTTVKKTAKALLQDIERDYKSLSDGKKEEPIVKMASIYIAGPKIKGGLYNVYVEDNPSVLDIKKRVYEELKKEIFDLPKTFDFDYLNWQLFYDSQEMDDSSKFFDYYSSKWGPAFVMRIPQKEKDRAKAGQEIRFRLNTGKKYCVLMVEKGSSVFDIKKNLHEKLKGEDSSQLQNAVAFQDWSLIFGGEEKNNSLLFFDFYVPVQGRVDILIPKKKKESIAKKDIRINVIGVGEKKIYKLDITEDTSVLDIKKQVYENLKKENFPELLQKFADYKDWLFIYAGKDKHNNLKFFYSYDPTQTPPAIKPKKKESISN